MKKVNFYFLTYCFTVSLFSTQYLLAQVTPVVQASNISFQNIRDTELTASWVNGNGDSRVVFIKAGGEEQADPTDNVTYNVGDNTPGGWECIYNGSGNTSTIQNLFIGIEYSIHICEYNGSPGSERYLITSSTDNPAFFNTIFSEQSGITLPGVSSGSAAWGDFDNDNYLDIIIAGSGISKIYKNNGNNTFSELTSVNLNGNFVSSIALGDYDADGNIDIILSGGYTISRVYHNDGNNNFSLKTGIQLEQWDGHSVSWGDFDNDGDLDVLSSGRTESGFVARIYRNDGNDTFTKLTSVILRGGQFPKTSWVDFDNDGDLDIYVNGHNPMLYTEIFSNNGNGSFTALPVKSIADLWEGSSEWGDYDEDGFQDLVLTGHDDFSMPHTRLYWNNGNGTFTENTTSGLIPVKNSTAIWGDYDKDGKLDLLISGMSASGPVTKIYRNEGNDHFEEQKSIHLPPLTNVTAAWGDYDNDDDLDLFLSGTDFNGTNISKIFRNNQQTLNQIPSAPLNLQYVIGEKDVIINWDKVQDDETSQNSIAYNIRIGKTDLSSDVVPSHSSLTGFRRIIDRGNAGLSTSFRFSYPRWFTDYHVRVQALDNSFKGGPFSEKIIINLAPVQASGMCAKHIDNNSISVKWKRGNGDRCIMFAKEGPSVPALPVDHITYYANSVFGEGSPLSNGWYCMYKGEGDSALVSGLDPLKNYTFHIIEYQGKTGNEVYSTAICDNIGLFGTSVFSEQFNISGFQYGSVSWADFNNDRFLDFLVAGEGKSDLYSNNRDNTFTKQTGALLTGVSWGSAAAGDFDGDDDMDIAMTGVASGQRITKIYRNDGNFIFVEQSCTITGSYMGSITWSDYDNDGDLDILLNGQKGSSIEFPFTKIYRNDESTFNESGISLPGLFKAPGVWGDYDNDGDPDLLISGNPNRHELFQNENNEIFNLCAAIDLNSAGYGNADWGDYNKDGLCDILTIGGYGSSYNSDIYTNQGNNEFLNFNISDLAKVYDGSSYWFDFNNDGYSDIIITGTDPDYNLISKIFKNNGNGSFSEQVDVQLTPVRASSIAWGDYDNDGDQDLLLAGITGGGGMCKLFRNNIIMRAGSMTANKRPAAPTDLTNLVIPGSVKLSWEPVSDDETISAALSYNVRYRKSGETSWKNYPMASDNGYRLIPARGNSQLNDFVILKNLDAGSYEWQVQAIDQAYAGSEWSVIGTFNLKTVQAFFSADEACLGSPTSFNDFSIATKGITSWNWDLDDGSFSTDQNPVHTYSQSGTYNVKLTITDPEGTTDILTQPVIVRPKPLTDFNAPSVCQGTPVTATNLTDNNGLTISSWSWDFGDGSSSSLRQPAPHPYLTVNDYTISLNVTASNGCANLVNKVVSVGSYPVAAVTSTGPLTFCNGDSVTLSVPFVSEYSYAWKTSGINLTGAAQNTYKVKNSGNYTVEIVNPKGNCASITPQVAVTVLDTPPAPLISVTGNLAFCQGDSAILSVNSVPGYSYDWKLNGGTISMITNSVTAKASGDYTVFVSNSSGCKAGSVNKITINVNPRPASRTISTSGSTTFCQGSSVTLSVSPEAGCSYSWRNDTGPISEAVSSSYTASITGKYKLDIANTYGCTITTAPVDILVKQSPAPPSIYPSGATTFCDGDSIILSVTRIPDYSYSWKLDGGAFGTDKNTMYANRSGEYSIVVTNPAGCSLSSVNKITVTVNPSPSLRTISTSGLTTFCQGSSVTLSVSPENECSYSWRNENGPITGAISTSYLVSKTGVYRLNISNASGCSITTSPVNVLVKQSPGKPVLENANYTKGQCPGESPVRLSTIQVTGYKYQWSKNEQLQAYDTLPYIEFFEAGNYKLTAELNGCLAESDLFSAEFPAGPAKPVIYAEGPTYWYLACSNTEANAYKWYWNGKLIENATNYYFTANQKLGVYQVSVGDKNGCFTKSDPVTIPPGYTGLEETDPFSALKIYPNPTTGLFTVEMDNNIMGELSIDIFTQAGNKILNIKFEKTTQYFKSQVDLSGQSKGMYVINFLLKKYFTTRKVMVE